MPLVALAAAGALSLWLSRRSAQEGPPDHRSAAMAIFEYLGALEGENPQRLADLVPATDEGQTEVEDRLRRFGGARVGQAEVKITAPQSSTVLAVSIRTVGSDARALAWTENMVWSEGAWRLLLGGACDQRGTKPSGPEDPASE